MKCLRCWIFCFALLLLITSTANAYAVNGIEPVYASGLVWDDIDVIESNLREDQLLSANSFLPSSVDLKEYFPTPGDQGHQNSCTAWAVGYALKSHQEESARSWGLHTDEHLFSPSYVYNQRENYDEDAGMSIISAFDIILEQGVCTFASFPYDEFDCNTQPTDVQIEEAACFKILDYYSIRGIDSFKRHLANGDGIVIGIEVYPDLNGLCESNPVYDVVSGTSSGGHTITLIGYSDEKEAFEFINSWGTEWGIDGYGWISYDLINDIRVSHFGEALGFVMVSHDAPILIENSFEYTVSELGEASIVRYIGSDCEVVIPDTLGGYPVTAIGRRAFQNNTSLTDVVISDNVLEIGAWAFAGTALNDIVIPDSVARLGEASFRDCLMLTDVIISDGITAIEKETFKNTGLVSITVPEGVEYIGRNAFNNCNSLTRVIISNSNIEIFYGVFSDLPDNAIIYVPNTPAKTIVANSGFPKERIIAEKEYGICGDDLTWDFNKENGTLTISGTGDMWNYTGSSDTPWYSLRENIKKIFIGSEVNGIGEFAFKNCIAVEEITIGGSVIFIAKGAFQYCTSLVNIIIPENVTDIGAYIFDNCTSLTNIVISGNVKVINDYAFYGCCSLTDLVIPDGVTYIGTQAFAGCYLLSELLIPNNVTHIGYAAFYGLDNIIKIYAPNKTVKALVVNSGFPEERIFGIVTESGICGENLTWKLDTEGILTISGTGSMYDYVYSPWYFCSDSIKKVIIEEGVTAIGEESFDNCYIEDITINMSEVGLTFVGMQTLQTITIGDSVSSVANGAFAGLDDTARIYVPNYAVRNLVINCEFPEEQILWTIIRSGACGDNLIWKLDCTGTLEISGNGEMMNDALDNLTISEREMIKKLVIGDGVTSIGDLTFFKCESLSDIHISDTVTYIGSLAFNGCVSLTNVIIPDSVTFIGFEAFSNLTEFFPDGIYEPLPNFVINCNEKSYAHDYAIENDIPFKLFNNMSKTIDVIPITDDIIVNSITVTSTSYELYNLTVNFQKAEDVLFILAIYDGEQLRKIYLSDDNVHIKGITGSDLKNGKIYIWSRDMQPYIKSVYIDI